MIMLISLSCIKKDNEMPKYFENKNKKIQK